MNKIFKITINKKYSLIFLSVFILLMLYIHKFIYLGGDDFIYGSYVKGDITEFFNNHIYHYMFKNGRAIVHFIVTLFLICDVYLWRIINPIIIGCLIILISKLSSSDKNKYKKSIVLSIVLFSFISINISREAIYWLDGSFNYLYPIVIFLLNIYLVNKSIENNKNYWYLPIIGFIAGATVEQVGLMTIGILFLILIDRLFINKKKINSMVYVNFVVTIIGYLTVVLAPGNFIRSSKQNPEIIGNAIQLFRYNFMSDKMKFFMLLLMISSVLWLISFIKKGYNKKLNCILMILMVLNFIVYSLISCFTSNITQLANKFISENIGVYTSLWKATSVLDGSNIFGALLWALATASGCFTVIVLLYQGIMVYIKEKNLNMIAFIIVAIGAQFMMIISPVFGYRTVFPSLIAWFIVIILSIVNNLDNKYVLPMILICTILSINNTYFNVIGLIIIMIFILYKNLKFTNMMKYLIIFMLGISVLINIQKTIVGFKENAPIHEYNINAIREYKDNNCKGELNLKKAKNFEYRYTMIYESEPHANSFKRYYELPEVTVINFK